MFVLVVCSDSAFYFPRLPPYQLSELRVKSNMDDFRSGKVEVLVGTDMLARGTDVPQCSLVVHNNPELDATKYLHRSRRTGRAGTDM